MAQDSTAHLVRVIDQPELAPGDPGDAVVAGQPLVQEGVVGRVEFEQAPVLAQKVPEEELRLADEVVAQLSREVRVEVRLGDVVLGVLKPEPLRGEPGGERLGAGIGEHPTDLVLEHPGVGEPCAGGELEELSVGRCRPEEEGEAVR